MITDVPVKKLTVKKIACNNLIGHNQRSSHQSIMCSLKGNTICATHHTYIYIVSIPTPMR